MREVVIVSACRTPIGKFMGVLKSFSARDLAMAVGTAAIERAGVNPELIDEICMGQLFTGMQGSLPARQVGLRIGLPVRSSSVSVNQNCASGMRALEIACHNIMLGKTDIGLVVGAESMTNAPYLLPKARMGYRMNAGKIEDSMIHDGLYDELSDGHMAMTAENIAEKYDISREECDNLALMSHRRAVKAIEEGRFKAEIIPLEKKSRKGTTVIDTDEHPIIGADLDIMRKMKTVFKKDGVVTAANASGINDGAAAVLLMSKDKALEMGITPMVKLVNICSEGVDPDVMGLGPAVAIPKCLKQSNMAFDDVDYWEINEAFAAQWLGVGKMLNEDYGIDLDVEKINHNGSGISLGHPVGCTGLRIVVTLCHEMKRLNLKTGGASLCVGGGPAMASLWTSEI